jgi:hypothetical protein
MRLGISLNRVENGHEQSIAVLPVRKLWKMVAIASAGSVSSTAMTGAWPIRRAKTPFAAPGNETENSGFTTKGCGPDKR